MISTNSPRAPVVFAALFGLAFTSSPGQTQPALPTVYVLATGGTISGRGASSTSLTEYTSGALLGAELVSAGS